jgi:hypothetical protein
MSASAAAREGATTCPGTGVPSALLLAADPRVRAAAQVAASLSRAVRGLDFADWDVYDALASPLLEGVARTALARQVVLQALKRSPVNVRGPLRVPKLHHTKGLALFASAYARLALLDPAGPGSPAAALAAVLGDRLAARAIEHPAGGAGWGYDFPMQTRWGRYRAGEPNAVGTAFGGHALLDVAEATGDASYAALAARAAAFSLDALLVERGGERFFAYYEGASAAIHNSSLLLAALCARALERGDERLAGAADAVAFSVACQRPDGSWPYGEEDNLGWVDGFHTAYNLDALDVWQRATGDEPAREALERGLELYLERLIDPDGAARASLGSRYPVDIHAVATAISTLTTLSRRGFETGETADRVLDWTLANMRRSDGRFAFQKHRRYRNSVPYIRWGDGHMLLGLANYLTERETK